MLQEIRQLFHYHAGSTIRLAEHDLHNVFGKALSCLERFGFSGPGGKTVLDLGCGQRFPFALLCAACGARVTALDINYIRPDPLPLAFLRILQHNGPKRAVKSALRRILWDKRYYRALEEAAGRSLYGCCSKIAFIAADPAAAAYPLAADSCDLIASNAVLEHVADLPRFAAEAARLLKPGGFFYAIIHNFYSLSGGHNLAWAFPAEHQPARVPPWDHLRENRFPAWTSLNRAKPGEYKAVFTAHLELLHFAGVGINHDEGELEGEHLLTAEIAAELDGYPRDLLLTRSWCMLCRKPA